MVNKITKRDGRVVDFDKEKIINAIFKAAQSVGGEDRKLAEDSSDLVVKELEAKFKEDSPTVEQVQDIVEKILIEKGHAQTAKAYILYRKERAEERRSKAAVIGKDVKTKFSLNSLRVLKERYLLKDDEGKVIETPDGLIRRVAKNIAKADLNYSGNAKEAEEKFYELMVNLDFLPNSPTLMNAGTDIQQLAACFVLPIEDSMEGIFTTLMHAAIIHKSGGGTGFSFSSLRGKNSRVKSTQGVASGPVSFLTVYNAATDVIKQGGKRRGANMGILRIDHPDILDFINCKEKNEDITNFNISVALTEDFMKSVENDEEYELIDPSTQEVVEELNARTVFDLIIGGAWRNGDPGIVFIDRINKDNPTPALGKIESTNPCGEQPLLPYEACNLGSLNLGHFVKDNGVDWERLKQVVHDCIHFLDNVIDMSRYPIPEITENVKKNRKIGLGVMGWADMLVQLKVSYNSEEAIKLAEKVMGFIKKEADNTSVELAKTRGVFPAWEESIYNKASKHFQGVHMELRNATRTTIAPTGTIGMIADASGGVEPLFALSYVKRVMDGQELYYLDENFKKALVESKVYSEELMEKIINKSGIQDIEEVPEPIREVFVVAHDVSPEYHLKMQGAFQKFTDNAVSKTVNFLNSATIDEVKEVYLLAYNLGCKGVTVYRDGSKDMQVLNFTKDIKKKKKSKDVCPECNAKMVMSEGCAKCSKCGYSICS
ncbi:vitamin B12-dependent ribonucleotide reductase [Candidatus Woesearchaeota archaeon]|nr:vitamin B12-dependent ribonucleotide reductase [Candidatus Woesearchaeota archaeon]